MSPSLTAFLLPATLLVALAVLFAVSMLWQRSRRLAIVLALVIPAAAAGLYVWHGTPAGLATAPPPPAEAPSAANEPVASDAEVARMLADLEAKLAADPSQWEGWALLGRARMELGEYDKARDAYAKAHELKPDDDMVGVGYAEALMRSDPEHRFPPQAVALLERAAGANPPDERAVFFLGMHQMLSGDPGAAAAMWEGLLPRLDKDAAAALVPQIAAAKAAAARIRGGATPAATGPGVRTMVTVADAVASGAPAGSVLFVFARAPGGSGPPLAVKRVVVDRWPVEVHLTDADNPMGGEGLSKAEAVEIVARVSRSGNAQGAKGDLESGATTVHPADGKPVVLVIDRVRP
jgi:cytochrome c-type biogenesis protein CcmH